MNSIHCNGIELNYSMEGSGDLTMLVVGSSIYYPRTFSKRLKQSFRFVCADLPHFVDFCPEFDTASIGFDFYAECIESMRTAAGLGRVVVAGHSHHGNVAIEYATRFPQYASHVVLIGSPPANIAQTMDCAERYWNTHASSLRKQSLDDRRASLDERHLASLSPKDAFVTKYVTDAPLYWHDPEYDARWLWAGMQFRMDAIHSFQNLFEEYAMRCDPESFKTPVLAVMGRDDFAVPHTLWTDGHADLRSVDVRVLDRCGHTPQLEQPDQFEKTLLSWLQQN